MKAVVLAGGQGTRFWPVSRKDHPKQFLKIVGSRTMLQETTDRLQPLVSLQDIYVVCSGQYVGQVRSQLPELAVEQIIVEPLARSTAPCIGLAATRLKRHSPDEVMAVLPSDHVVRRVDEFHTVLQAADQLSRQGWLVTFGIQPSYPATGYGYLLKGELIGEFQNRSAYQVARFTEKPDGKLAREFVEKGGYYWNSGMFVWSVETILRQIGACMPELGQALKEIDQNREDGARIEDIFSRLESISVDFGVMEKAEKVAVLPCDLGWSDIGNWRALEEVCPGDPRGVSSNTSYVNIDGRNCVLHASQEKMIALVGVENLVIVDTADALLICTRDRAEEVKKVVEYLEEKDFKKYL
jgi:mannose-1-phosphate guanylyltransferase